MKRHITAIANISSNKNENLQVTLTLAILVLKFNASAEGIAPDKTAQANLGRNKCFLVKFQGGKYPVFRRIEAVV